MIVRGLLGDGWQLARRARHGSASQGGRSWPVTACCSAGGRVFERFVVHVEAAPEALNALAGGSQHRSSAPGIPPATLPHTCGWPAATRASGHTDLSPTRAG